MYKLSNFVEQSQWQANNCSAGHDIIHLLYDSKVHYNIQKNRH